MRTKQATPGPSEHRHPSLRQLLLVSIAATAFGCGHDPGTILDGGAGTVRVTVDPIEPVPAPLTPWNDREAIVTLDGSTSPEAFADSHQLSLLEVLDSEQGPVARYGLPPGVDAEDLVGEPGALASDENIVVTLGEGQNLFLGFYEGEWSRETVDDQQWFDEMGLAELHDVTGGEGVVIAALDTGAYFEHPFFTDGSLLELTPDWGFSSREEHDGLDNDRDGEIDEAYGHGTHVAGVLLTVAPKATVIPIRVLNDDGVGSLWDILRGIDVARKIGADIVNLSLCLSASNASTQLALRDAFQSGASAVAAAGNYGNASPKYPATSPFALGVASVDAKRILSGFSGSGHLIHLAAPGENILSAYPPDALRSAQGTSIATPIVTGCIALVMSGRSIASREAVGYLRDTASPIVPSNGVQYGFVEPAAAIDFVP
ncbi:MAG: S8 family serine peptidase [Candidatus Eisenbacteria bacterium]|uniref:S8 family serine peptidase n=1 Tax=Eiseniibacteriota bacterium TaxID=2212470 RepID=A0A956M1K0_UNCEI|nr:S8 family serine peptidase [Candidatus Eisenbacteria bacterium]